VLGVALTATYSDRILLDDPKCPGRKVDVPEMNRAHRGRSCYAQSVALVVGQRGRKMADVTKVQIRWRTRRSFRKHVLHNRGGSSWVFLERLVGDGRVKAVKWSQGMRVNDAMRDPNVVSHTGKPTFGSKAMNHSVAVIGHRYVDPTNPISTPQNDMFLLQSSWYDKQFFEATREFLQLCGAKLWRVKGNVSLDATLVTDLLTAESAEAFDGEEGEEELEGSEELDGDEFESAPLAVPSLAALAGEGVPAAAEGIFVRSRGAEAIAQHVHGELSARILSGANESAEIWAGLGVSYFALGRLEEATTAFQSAPRLRSCVAEWWASLGLLHEFQGEVEQAWKVYDTGLRLLGDGLCLRARLDALKLGGGGSGVRTAGYLPRSLVELPEPSV
jgi:hypothetical protein